MDNFVWAKFARKVKPWPGKICTPPETGTKPDLKASKWIFFFGLRKYEWVRESNIQSYLENRDAIAKTIKEKVHKNAIKEIDEYMSDPEKYGTHLIEANLLSENNNSPTVSRGGPRKKVVIKKEPRTPKRIDNNAPDEGPVEKRRKDEANVDASQKCTSLQKPKTDTSSQTFGFLGVGIMGSRIVKHLIDSGHKVFVWDRDPWKSEDLKSEVGVEVATSLCNLVEQVDIIFVCVSGPLASKELVFGEYKEMLSNQHFNGKGYVEVTGLDSSTSENIADAIESRGGRYLEAQLLGSKHEAEEGTLVLLTAGDESLFNECESCFHAMGKKSLFLGDIGNASKMYLVLQSLRAVQLATLSEALALADRAKLPLENVVEIFKETPIASQYLLEKGRGITNRNHEPYQRLTRLQNDLGLALEMANDLKEKKLTMPITAAANEAFTQAIQNGLFEKL